MTAEIPWFAGEPGAFLVFRINRRPLQDPTLFTPQMPEDVFEHFTRMLAPGYQVVTGRRHQRTWRVGGVVPDREAQTVTGKLGWLPVGEEVVPEWSEEDKDWLSSTTTPQGGRIVPFGFDGESRLLTVLSDRSSAPATVAAVFERILRENERELEIADRSTEWSVEPILDVEDFLSWLGALDMVASVSFTARLPNPEPRDAFRDLAERMATRRATQYTETMKSGREEGLIGVEEDRDFRQAIAMGEQGFATLRGSGRRGGEVTRYSQTSQVATEHVEELPEDWPGVFGLIRHFLKERLRRFLDEGGPN